MAGAAGGFVTWAFEAMLKECAANRGKFTVLQQSIQSYLESIKGAKAEGAVITEALASAGRVLDGPQDELVLQPLRLAVETKHVKLVEPALDCLHGSADMYTTTYLVLEDTTPTLDKAILEGSVHFDGYLRSRGVCVDWYLSKFSTIPYLLLSWLHKHHNTHHINDGKGKIQCLLPYDCCPNFSTVNTTQQKAIHSFRRLVTDDALIRALQPMTMSPSSNPTTSMHHPLKENLDSWEDIAFPDLLLAPGGFDEP